MFAGTTLYTDVFLILIYCFGRLATLCCVMNQLIKDKIVNKIIVSGQGQQVMITLIQD